MKSREKAVHVSSAGELLLENPDELQGHLSRALIPAELHGPAETETAKLRLQ